MLSEQVLQLNNPTAQKTHIDQMHNMVRMYAPKKDGIWKKFY